MAFTAQTGDILWTEAGLLYSMTAYGAIKAGQCLTAYGTMQVDQADSDDANFIGVALYSVADGKPIAVAGPGNIVYCTALDTITVGTEVYCSGALGNVAGNGSNQIGVALEESASGSTFRVLLK